MSVADEVRIGRANARTAREIAEAVGQTARQVRRALASLTRSGSVVSVPALGGALYYRPVAKRGSRVYESPESCQRCPTCGKWGGPPRALLGTMPDTELARRYGVNRSTVKRLREIAGVPRFAR